MVCVDSSPHTGHACMRWADHHHHNDDDDDHDDDDDDVFLL